MAYKFIGQGAKLSPDRLQRYTLWRVWDVSKPLLLVIGLNPSTADEMVEDPTIRKCIGFAKAWGYGGLIMTNVYSLRSTDPAGIRGWQEPAGNAYEIVEAAKQCSRVLAAWGGWSKGSVQDRLRLRRDGEELLARLCRRVDCLGTTADLFPKHPLYIPYSQEPVRYWDMGRIMTP